MTTPETRYAQSPDGLIDYQIVGDGPIDLLYLSGGTSHVDVRWEWEGMAHFLNRLASISQLILFDRRGTGASDPVSGGRTPTWEDWAEDLSIVLDAADSDQAAIFATLDGGPMAMVFAASHPDRTRALILGNTGAKFMMSDDYPIGLSPDASENLVKLVEAHWGTVEMAAINSPSRVEDPDFLRWFAKFQRASSTPRATAAFAAASVNYDARGALGLIQAQTLVMHRRDYSIFPVEIGRYLAEHISGATYVELDGADSGLSWGPGVDFILETVEEFLTGTKPVANPDRVLATVLFTDIVDSSHLAAEMGDRRWTALLDKHDTLARSEIDRNRGRLLKSTGDGILATFDAPGRAIRAAISIRDGLKGLGLSTYIGLHTGELELRDQDVGGIAVNIAARVLEEAKAVEPGIILVSGSIPPLVAGSGIEFDSIGGRRFKGIPGEWTLFAVKA